MAVNGAGAGVRRPTPVRNARIWPVWDRSADDQAVGRRGCAAANIVYAVRIDAPGTRAANRSGAGRPEAAADGRSHNPVDRAKQIA